MEKEIKTMSEKYVSKFENAEVCKKVLGELINRAAFEMQQYYYKDYAFDLENNTLRDEDIEALAVFLNEKLFDVEPIKNTLEDVAWGIAVYFEQEYYDWFQDEIRYGEIDIKSNGTQIVFSVYMEWEREDVDLLSIASEVENELAA